jgi:hypothetical protein
MPTNQEFWTSRIGALYDANGVLKLTKLSKTALRDRLAALEILAVTTVDGDVLFPAFQFGDDGKLLPAAATVTHLLEPIADDSWDVALWLNTRTSRFDGRRAVDEMRAGRIADVLRWAERDGRILDN